MKPKIYIRVANRGLGQASIRYRGLLPGCALQDLGWEVTVGAGDATPPTGTDVVFAIKPLLERDAAWVRSIGRGGTPVIVDLCDNVFIRGYADQGDRIGNRFIDLANDVAAVTVPTDGLRQSVVAQTALGAENVFVVPDIVESPTLLARQRTLVDERETVRERLQRLVPTPGHWFRRAPVLLWFGNHGASYANFGMDDLLLFDAPLRMAAQRFGAELWVVSNKEARFRQLARRLPIRSRYFEWTPGRVDQLLPRASACLVPNSLDPFSITKSANRAVKSLSAGVPVVATPTPAYAGLELAIWLGDPSEGLAKYLEGDSVRAMHLGEARRVLATDYSISALRRSLLAVLDSARMDKEVA